MFQFIRLGGVLPKIFLIFLFLAISHFGLVHHKKTKLKLWRLQPPPQLLIGCMEILFLKLAATIFGLDYLIALLKNILAIEFGGGGGNLS
jgi:hypothetical protein